MSTCQRLVTPLRLKFGYQLTGTAVVPGKFEQHLSVFHTL